MPDIPSKFQKDPSITFRVILLTQRQTDKQTKSDKNITSLAEVITSSHATMANLQKLEIHVWWRCKIGGESGSLEQSPLGQSPLVRGSERTMRSITTSNKCLEIW